MRTLQSPIRGEGRREKSAEEEKEEEEQEEAEGRSEMPTYDTAAIPS